MAPMLGEISESVGLGLVCSVGVLVPESLDITARRRTGVNSSLVTTASPAPISGEFPHDGDFSVLSRGQLSVLRKLSAGQTRSLQAIMNRALIAGHPGHPGQQ